MKQFFEDFKAFTMRGNVVDMAVGIIIGAAFGKIVSSLVGDIIMPGVGLLIGGVDFSNLAIVLKQAVVDANGKEIAPAVLIKYGAFIQVIFDFIIVAFAIFMMIKGITILQRKKESAPSVAQTPAKKTPQEELLTEIRDILKKNNN
ncbi:MAG: large-conductance mechanosensitive channel protein MscL [Bacteroidales bacterium]